MKTSKRFLALMLSALMIFSVVFIPGADFSSLFSIEAEAAITLGGITQQRVVGADGSYANTYAGYASKFFGGGKSWPTNFVIPGLGSADDYTPQGMTYWEEKEWILISAYDASGAGRNSVIYALDAVTTNFVALFKIVNADGTVNTSHGGGIAASEYNFYYADTSSNISYVPLSEMNVDPGEVKEIKLVDSIDCSGELNGAATSYCCYEDGVLWTGNFHWVESNTNRYSQPAHPDYYSMLIGYKLHGNSSEEEWYYLSKNTNKVKLNSTSSQTAGTLTFTTTSDTYNRITISGSSTTDVALGEATAQFGTLNLIEGKQYIIEFIADNNLSDMYLFSPSGTHCNVKQSKQSKITSLGDGRYHYQMTFTAGLKPASADSSWPTTQSTDGSYTGKYTIRFDQDSVPAGGRSFTISEFSVIEKYEEPTFEIDPSYEKVNCAGNPTYCIGLENKNTETTGGNNNYIDRVQYAMVSKGKIYISRSWSRNPSGNHTRELAIADLDINSPGTDKKYVNGRYRDVHYVSNASLNRFGGDFKDYNDANNANLNQMLFMGEALCVIDDYLYMFSEGAAWTYNGKDSSSTCDEPIDVIWKIDQHALNNVARPADDVGSIRYDKVTDISELSGDDSEYLIVFESNEKDPVTQKNILYALDSYGSYDDGKLPKKKGNEATVANTKDSMGIVGYPITAYSTATITTNGKSTDTIYLNDTDDNQDSIRWVITSNGRGGYRFLNSDYYYGNNRYLSFNERIFCMNSDAQDFGIAQINSTGDFAIYYGDGYYLWCNDGTLQDCMNAYTNYYSNHGITEFVPHYNNLEEEKGTFHSDINKKAGINSGNIYQAINDFSFACVNIYKKIPNVYASTSGTDIYTDLTTKLESDGTYTMTLETYATAAVQYMDVPERPTDFVFLVDTSSNTVDANGYHTESGWKPLKMNQVCGDKSDSFFNQGDNYNTAHSGNFYFKFPDGEFGKIYVAFNESTEKDWLGRAFSRDIWLWAEHPISKRCYRLSKSGFMTHGNFAGGDNWEQDNSYRITDDAFIANQQNLGWANQAAVMVDVKADRYRTDYHGVRNSDGNRASYEVMNYTKSGTYNGVTLSFGPSYYTNASSTRLEAIQQLAEQMSYKIAADSTEHRISLVTYSDSVITSYMVSDSGAISTATTTGTTDYKKVFFNNSQFSLFRNEVNALVSTGSTSQPMNGLTRAANTLSGCGQDYTPTGNRAACIILLTTGEGLSDTDISNALLRARECKDRGAFIYTIKVGGVDENSNNVKNFFDYTSSNYVYAESLAAPGDRNKNSDIDYYFKLNNYTRGNFGTAANDIISSAITNSTKAYLKINKDTIIREAIGEFFLTGHLQNSDFRCETLPSSYDGLGRLYFDESKKEVLSSALDNNYMTPLDTHTLKIKGFDFTKNYISQAHQGKKLRVTVTGLLLNPDYGDLSTVYSTREAYTGIYLNEEYMNNNNARKGYPVDAIHIPEYTYILDYGVSMYDSDINGTLLSVDSIPQKQSPYKSELNRENMSIQFTNGNQDMIYTTKPNSTCTLADSRGFCLIERDDGTYDWFRINVLPASNVYYEESVISTPVNNGTYTKWTSTGTPLTFKQELTSSDDVYGYDSSYASTDTGFSYGSAFKSTVAYRSEYLTETGETNVSNSNRSDTLIYDYNGEAVDLYASCGKETGIYIITIRNKTENSIEKVYILDTYFSDASYYSDGKKINQVPILHHENAYPDNYSVEITSAYLSSVVGKRDAASPVSTFALDSDVTFYTRDITEQAKEAILVMAEMEDLLEEDIEVIFCDENSVLNGGTGAGEDSAVDSFITTFGSTGIDTDRGFTTLTNYFDGIRVYHRLDADTINSNYVNNEKGAEYYSIINSVIDGNEISSGSSLTGVAYVERVKETDPEYQPENDIIFSNYEKTGPENELYLMKDKSVAFNVQLMDSSSRVMISLRAVNGATTAKINDKALSISTSNELYYDITSYLTPDESSGIATVTVENIGNGLLAIANMKLCNSAAVAPMMMASMSRIRMMMAAPAEEVEPNIPKDEESAIEMPSDVPYIEPFPEVEEEETTDNEQETPDDNTDSDSILNIFEDILAEIKSFFDMIIRFFKTLFA